jgi:hypothetical protein
MVHVENHCTRGWGVFKWEACGGKGYIARGQTDGMANVNQSAQSPTDPSQWKVCVVTEKRS